MIMMINLKLLIDRLNEILLRFLKGENQIESFMGEFSSPLRRMIGEV
jgi:hypothetical protein